MISHDFPPKDRNPPLLALSLSKTGSNPLRYSFHFFNSLSFLSLLLICLRLIFFFSSSSSSSFFFFSSTVTEPELEEPSFLSPPPPPPPSKFVSSGCSNSLLLELPGSFPATAKTKQVIKIVEKRFIGKLRIEIKIVVSNRQEVVLSSSSFFFVVLSVI